MAEFNIRADSVDVTRIMEQIRERIREKRGTDYTEQQIRELATVKLESFLDPGQVRSDLVEHYRQLDPPKGLDPVPSEGYPPPPEVFDFDQETIYASSRGPMGKLIRLIRKLLNPLLKLFFNPSPVVFALSRQAEINAWTVQLLQRQTDLIERVSVQFDQVGKKFAAREQLDALNYEVLNNLVVEMTRLSVDVKNHKMLVESVSGRLDFSERRSRALESVVQKRSVRPPDGAEGAAEEPSATGTTRTRRRRRRPRRRPGDGDANAARQTTSEGSGASAPQGALAESAPPTTESTAPAGATNAAPPEAAHASTDTPASAPRSTPAEMPAPVAAARSVETPTAAPVQTAAATEGSTAASPPPATSAVPAPSPAPPATPAPTAAGGSTPPTPTAAVERPAAAPSTPASAAAADSAQPSQPSAPTGTNEP